MYRRFRTAKTAPANENKCSEKSGSLHISLWGNRWNRAFSDYKMEYFSD